MKKDIQSLLSENKVTERQKSLPFSVATVARSTERQGETDAEMVVTVLSKLIVELEDAGAAHGAISSSGLEISH